tara:strand:- start:3047 stop:3211 length:165 start_codon:yes stop_codon:yes gene_type:complete
MWDRFIDKLATFIGYLCLPITYPIYLYQMKQLDKKYEERRKERELIDKRNKLRK